MKALADTCIETTGFQYAVGASTCLTWFESMCGSESLPPHPPGQNVLITLCLDLLHCLKQGQLLIMFVRTYTSKDN